MKNVLENDFEEFVIERALNLSNNPYFGQEKSEDSDDMSIDELKMKNDLVLASYKKGFVDAIQLFCK